MIKSMLGHKGDKPSEGKGGPRRQHNKAKTQADSWSIDDFQVDAKEGETRFHDIGLRDELMHAIADLGFQYCLLFKLPVCPIPFRATMLLARRRQARVRPLPF